MQPDKKQRLHIGRYSLPRTQGLGSASVGEQLAKQVTGFGGALGRCQLQPVACALGCRIGCVRAQAAIFELGLRVTGAGRLTQQFVAHAPITCAAAFVTEHLAQATLRHDDALAGRLLEQASGQVLDAGFAAQVGTVEQPEGDLEREALARCSARNTVRERDGFFALKHMRKR